MTDRWLTYEEAGQMFGLSAEAMRKRARRLGWRIQIGNDNQTKTRILVPDGAELRPAGPPPGYRVDDRPDARADELREELRRRAEAAEARVQELVVDLVQQKERSARAEGEAVARREALVRETRRLEQAETARQQVEAAAKQLQQKLEQFGRVAAAREAELGQARAQEVKRREEAEAARKAADAARQAAETARDTAAIVAETARAELGDWTAGGPLARAWRALVYRRGRG